MTPRALIIFCLLIILFQIDLLSQVEVTTYVWKGETNEPSYCFAVTEIRIKADQTYDRIDFTCGDKQDSKNYKNWKIDSTQKGKIEEREGYFVFVEYRNGIRSDKTLTAFVKLNEIRFFYRDVETGKRKRGLKYRKVSL
jgi:hypothetical protein